MTRKMPKVFALAAALAVAAILQAASAIDGKWQFNLQTDGGPREAAVEMKTDGELVSGTWDTTELKGTFKDGTLALSFPLRVVGSGDHRRPRDRRHARGRCAERHVEVRALHGHLHGREESGVSRHTCEVCLAHFQRLLRPRACDSPARGRSR